MGGYLPPGELVPKLHALVERMNDIWFRKWFLDDIEVVEEAIARLERPHDFPPLTQP